MTPESALVEDQVSVMFCPETRVEGDAIKLAVGSGPLPPLGPLCPPQLARTMHNPKSTNDDFALPQKQRLKEFLTAVKVPIASSIVLLF
jgi:hypothetical protein